MLRQLHIEHFRALRDFTMTGLNRVNLLVGTNNCGKTSVLEAIEVLSSPGMPGPLWNTLLRRGETRDDADELEVEVAHVLHGHTVDVGSRFSVVGRNDNETLQLAGLIQERDTAVPLPTRRPPRQRSLFESGEDDEAGLAPVELVLDWRRQGVQQTLRWPLTRRGGLLRDVLMSTTRKSVTVESPVHFITTEGLTQDAVVALFDETVLTRDEETVVNALKTIEPGIERLASVGGSRRSRYKNRGGIAMLLEGKRVPVGSMGDGIWRLLGIALALVRSEGGTILVDEIDTGLHYTVLVDMWRLVTATASRLDVQVFATTHSRDCYEALASVAEQGAREISLQRIERDKTESIAFTALEIQRAAERGIEIR